MEDMDKKEIKEVIEWCDEKGHSEHEILDLSEELWMRSREMKKSLMNRL